MHFQNCHRREFCVGEYFSKSKSFVFYSLILNYIKTLILKHSNYKTHERTNHTLERNYYIGNHIYVHTFMYIHISTHIHTSTHIHILS